MASQDNSNARIVTVRGRLSYPTFTAEAAYQRSLKGSYPAATVAEAAPDFTLLLEPDQLDKLRTKVIDEFLPSCKQLLADGNTKAGLNDKEIAQLVEQIKDPEFDGTFNTPFKTVPDKTVDMAPEAVAAVKVIGNKGVDIVEMARVDSEDDLAANDGRITKFPQIVKIDESVHQLYAGCVAAVTINLYSYHNGKLPGFSAGGSTCVFIADGERFGGGVAVDADEMFMD